jgi:sugar lactone lactonase YvrE
MSYLHDRACLRVAFSFVMLVAGTVPASAAFLQFQYEYLTDIGSGPGTAVGEVNAPSGIAAFSTATEHGIFVADTNNNRIQQVTFDAMGPGFSIFADATAGTAVGKVNQPRGVAVDSVGRVYVADTANNRIQVNTGGMASGWSVFAGATAGTAVGKVNQPQGVAIDTTGAVYIADTLNNRIQINTDGTASGWNIFAGATAGTAVGKVNQPRGIYVDSVGSVYVADTSNNRVQRADPGPGGFTWAVLGGAGTAPGQFNAPQGVAARRAGSEGVIFVADTGNNRIQMSLDSGMTWSIVADPGTGPGQVSAPRGLALADYTGDGRPDLIVADTGNNRVQVYSYVPEPSATVLIGMAVATLGFRRWRFANPTAVR